jgi:hypothetical protein
MVKSREHVTTNGRAVFFAAMWEDFRNAALDCGWALGLHGSLNSDMDIMAMPWTAEAVTPAELIQNILNCFDDSIWKEKEYKPFTGKPHGRIVYTISIFADFYLDISIIDVNAGVNGGVLGYKGVIGHPDPIGEPGEPGFKGKVLGDNILVGNTANIEGSIYDNNPNAPDGSCLEEEHMQNHPEVYGLDKKYIHDQEFLEFALMFSMRYHHLTPGLIYYSKEKKYQIDYMVNFHPIRIVNLKNIGRVGHTQGVIELNHDAIYDNDKYTPTFIFYFLIWCDAITQIPFNPERFLHADSLALKYCLENGSLKEELITGFLEMVSHAPTELNKKRIENFMEICNNYEQNKQPE